MSTVIFKNKGEIDPRTIRTFGVSVKDNENPIGFFGTGLKYAIAILLRTNHEITIWSGETAFVFAKKVIKVRGKDFEIITMNDEEMPFTTHLGTNWEVWQAFREIWCNTLDEGGDISNSGALSLAIKGEVGVTKIVVKGREFSDWYHDRHVIVLQPNPKTEVGNNGCVQILNIASKSIYYRGIRVLDLEGQSLFTYNILSNLTLTEDRTIKYEWEPNARIPRAIGQLKDRHQIRRILTAPKSHYESDISYGVLKHEDGLSPEFEAVLAEEFNNNSDSLSLSARQLHKDLHNRSSLKNLVESPLSTVEEKQFRRAIESCRQAGFLIDKYPIMVVADLGNEMMAFADRAERRVVISKRAFKMGTKYLASTMIEEYLHIKTGYDDCSRNLQTYLFDSIVSMIEDHVIKEPI